tara:strand:- start:3053 stop:3283 length:231 start_codon:yes stop_codon:yes gene_type:complete
MVVRRSLRPHLKERMFVKMIAIVRQVRSAAKGSVLILAKRMLIVPVVRAVLVELVSQAARSTAIVHPVRCVVGEGV